jgi:colanic acid biosynthesis glycosyl transferase WcaI
VRGCGICTAPGDAAALADAIELLLDNPETAERLGKSGPARVTERWLLTSIMDRFEQKTREMITVTGSFEPIELSQVHQG